MVLHKHSCFQISKVVFQMKSCSAKVTRKEIGDDTETTKSAISKCHGCYAWCSAKNGCVIQANRALSWHPSRIFRPMGARRCPTDVIPYTQFWQKDQGVLRVAFGGTETATQRTVWRECDGPSWSDRKSVKERRPERAAAV